MRLLRAVLPGLLPLLFAACLGNPPPPGGGMGGEAARAERAEAPEDAIIVEREELARSDDLLLYVLANHVPSITADYEPSTGSGDRCPRVSLRGPLVGTSLSNPVVYVDGTRTSDTCVLVNIRSTEVDWVELYPTGTTRRSGYVTHPHGLILVFTRRI